MWTLALWIRKEVENVKWGLVDHTCRGVEDSGAKSNVGFDGLAQEVLEENISKRPRDCSCDILENGAVVFCSAPEKNLPEAKLKNFGLMALAEKISR